jgi:hypothetical protein
MSTRDQIEKLYEGFAAEVETLTAEELKARIVRMQETLGESEAHKEANDSLKEARQAVSELAGPYNDVKKAVKLKTKYILELLKEKGAS